jgi:hypothetical protein
MTHDLPATFSSFADRLLVDRRFVVGSRRTQRRQTVDKPVGRRHFADRQTALCRRSDGGQTIGMSALCWQFVGGQTTCRRRTDANHSGGGFPPNECWHPVFSDSPPKIFVFFVYFRVFRCRNSSFFLCQNSISSEFLPQKKGVDMLKSVII